MTACPDRFEMVLDPSDLWTVWDCATETPATFGGVNVLIGLSEIEAAAACETLNEMHRRQESRQADAA